jgi:hypothetical protein
MRGRQLLLARTEARHHFLPPLDPAAASLYARGGPHGLRGWGAPMRGRSGLCRGSRACEAKGTHVRCKGGMGRRRGAYGARGAHGASPYALLPSTSGGSSALLPSIDQRAQRHTGDAIAVPPLQPRPGRSGTTQGFLGPLLSERRSPAASRRARSTRAEPRGSRGRTPPPRAHTPPARRARRAASAAMPLARRGGGRRSTGRAAPASAVRAPAEVVGMGRRQRQRRTRPRGPL